MSGMFNSNMTLSGLGGTYTPPSQTYGMGGTTIRPLSRRGTSGPQNYTYSPQGTVGNGAPIRLGDEFSSGVLSGSDRSGAMDGGPSMKPAVMQAAAAANGGKVAIPQSHYMHDPSKNALPYIGYDASKGANALRTPGVAESLGIDMNRVKAGGFDMGVRPGAMPEMNAVQQARAQGAPDWGRDPTRPQNSVLAAYL